MAKRSGLGRGLNSLLGASLDDEITYTPASSKQRGNKGDSEFNTAQGEYNPSQGTTLYKGEQVVGVDQPETPVELDIDKISPNPNQPRRNFDQALLEELASSIKQEGLLQPILVRKTQAGTYEIIAGERRWQASKLAGLKTVPVRIIEAEDDKVIKLAMIENIQRADLNPIEEAYGYKAMMEEQGLTQAQVAEAVSKGRSTVANALRLLELPQQAQDLLREDKISAGHARAILAIPSEQGRQQLTDKLVNQQLSVREAEAISRLLSGKTAQNKVQKEPLPASYKKVAKALKTSLNTNVRVKSSGGKNKIEIEFSDEEDLKRLFDMIAS